MDSTGITSILMIIGIDIVLGGDNAIVIALASKNLPLAQRNKAIYIGTALAIFIRVLLVILAASVLSFPFIQGIGGILLIYIAYKLLKDSNEKEPNIQGGYSIFAAVRTIVFADLIMGVDNILAIAGASHGNVKIMICGLLISIPIIIGGSKIILNVMEKYPFLLYIGASVIAFTAGEMIIRESAFQPLFILYPSLIAIVPFFTVALVLILAMLSNITNLKKLLHR